MKVKVQVWGNSLGLRIPKVYANELHVGAGSILELSLAEGVLMARPASVVDLDVLLAGVTPDNRHGEVDWGPGSGGEAW